MTKLITTIFLTLFLAGCWNGKNVHVSVNLGDVSLGQQLIDLKTALDEDAISPREYEQTKQRMLELLAQWEDTPADADRDNHHNRSHHEQDEDEDGFKWF